MVADGDATYLTLPDAQEVIREFARKILDLDARLSEPSLLEKLLEMSRDVYKARAAYLEAQLSPAEPKRAIEASSAVDIIGVLGGSRVL